MMRINVLSLLNKIVYWLLRWPDLPENKYKGALSSKKKTCPRNSDLQHEKLLRYTFIYFVLKASTKSPYLDRLLFLGAVTMSVTNTSSPCSENVKRVGWRPCEHQEGDFTPQKNPKIINLGICRGAIIQLTPSSFWERRRKPNSPCKVHGV